MLVYWMEATETRIHSLLLFVFYDTKRAMVWAVWDGMMMIRKERLWEAGHGLAPRKDVL